MKRSFKTILDRLKRRSNVAERQKDLPADRDLLDIGALAASITHDIQNPLGIIAAKIELIRRMRQSDEQLMKQVEVIEDQTSRIHAITRYIDLVRGTKEFYELKMSKIRLDEAIARAIRATKLGTGTSGVLFKYEDKPAFVKGSRDMIEQAIMNVLQNAVEAIHETKEMKGIVTVSVKPEREADAYRVTVEDNGCGMQLENVTTFFSTKAKKKANSGLGLFITNRILALHDGEVVIESTPPQGTKVSLIFPRWSERPKREHERPN